jgi:DNA polymerase III epsilon subunit-like protein
MNSPKLIFFDTETTGNTAEDFLCQIGYMTDEEAFSALYLPPKKIPPEASAVHHITNKMVAEKPAFRESPEYAKIKKLFEDENSVAVAHNAPFDLAMFKKEGILPTKFIDTLRVARHLDRDEKIEKYNLQYLRYLLDLDVEAAAHDAMGDVLVLEKLFKRLQKKIMDEEGLSPREAVEEMIEISSHPSLISTFKFGKYNGERVENVAKTDPGYLDWLLTQKLQGDGIDEDWIYTLRHYLGK